MTEKALVVDTKLILGKPKKKRKYPVRLVYVRNRIFFLSDYNEYLNSEIKLMSGHAYHGYKTAPMHDWVLKTFRNDKIWSVEDDQHNAFQIAYLQGKKPYARYKEALKSIEGIRENLYGHQKIGVSFLLTRRQCILAGEMGVGKTLQEITAREIAKPDRSWYVSSCSGIKAVERELRKWGCLYHPEMMTYNGLVKRMKSLEGVDFKPPQWLTLDESHNVKTPNTQRSQAAAMIADAMRAYWDDNCYIILMTGSPAPLSPLDWWMQCRIARPGYLVEGDVYKLKNRLGIIVDRDFGSGVHKHVETWKDRDGICNICGKAEDDPVHNPEMAELCDDEIHEFELAANEVKKLYIRLEGGLVLYQRKDDCLDLPKKRFEKIILEPSAEILRVARSLAKNAPSSAVALVRLRTLSDGFLYQEEKSGVSVCPICNGAKKSMDWVIKEEYEYNLPPLENGETDEEWRRKYFDYELIECIRCDGEGEVDTFHRETKEVPCPKEDALRDLIEQHTDVGRLVCYGGFTGSVDRIVRIFRECEWEYVRWDGRGIQCSVPGIDILDLFQDEKLNYPRVGFIGQPGAASTGLNLTASPSIGYWSNTFNAVDRIQSADRIHRIGMDVNRGATIFDFLHLPTDSLVLDNINVKIARQDLTMGVDVSMAQILGALNG